MNIMRIVLVAMCLVVGGVSGFVPFLGPITLTAFFVWKWDPVHYQIRRGELWGVIYPPFVLGAALTTTWTGNFPFLPAVVIYLIILPVSVAISYAILRRNLHVSAR